MIIAVNCIYYTEKAGGIKEYIFNLVHQLIIIDKCNRYIFYIAKENEQFWKDTMPKQAYCKVTPYNSNRKVVWAIIQNRFWYLENKTEKFDIFHSPFFHFPLFLKCKKIITVHDLRLLRYPQTYTLLRRNYLRYFVKKAISKADLVITVSEFTKREIESQFGISSDKINVIHEALNTRRFNKTLIPSCDILIKNRLVANKYLLSVGHLEPRKNYMNLINAYNLLSKEIRDNFKLVVVGKRNHDYLKVIKLINSSPGVIYLEYVSSEELVTLYQNSYIHIFPSIYEGFGFPILESSACGKPSIVSSNSSLPEIAGINAIVFNPFSVYEIYKSIKLVLKDDKVYNFIKKEAIKNLDRFSWEESVMKTIKVYESIFMI